jgi:hypothetical protein
VGFVLRGIKHDGVNLRNEDSILKVVSDGQYWLKLAFSTTEVTIYASETHEH